MQVTTESDDAESTLAGRKQPRGSSHQKIGVPEAWHSQQSHPAQITTLTRILTVRRVGGAGNLKLPTQWCGAVGFLRVAGLQPAARGIFDPSPFTRRRMSNTLDAWVFEEMIRYR